MSQVLMQYPRHAVMLFVMVIAFAFSSSNSHAADAPKKAAAKPMATALAGVAGHDGLSQGGVQFVPGKLEGDRFTFGLRNLQQGFTFTNLGAGCRQVTDTSTKKVGYNCDLPDGTVVHLFALGSEWGNMATDVAKVDLGRAKASGTLKGGAVTFQVAKNPEHHTYVYNLVAVRPDKSQLWAHIPLGTLWHAHNVNGAPFIMLSFNEKGDQVPVPANSPIRTALTQKR